MTALTLTSGDVWLLLYAGIAAMVAWSAWETGKWIFWRLVDRWGTETPEPRWADAIAPDPFLAEPDHANCEGEDCNAVICFCSVRGTNTECPGTTTQGCPHHNLLCWDCRPACIDCRIDARDQAEAEAERHWIGVRT